MRQVIEANQSIRQLKHLMFRKQGRMLFKLQRGKVLEFGGSESDKSDSSLDSADELADLKINSEKRKAFVNSLKGWKAKTSIEKKLVLGILHRKGHKNFEEREELEDVPNYGSLFANKKDDTVS